MHAPGKYHPRNVPERANLNVATMHVTVAGLVQDQAVDSTQLAAWLGRQWVPATTTKPQVDQALAGQL
eukprot:164400-Prymnesium_polylepis.1